MAGVSKHYPVHLTPGGPSLTRRLLSVVKPAAPVQSALLVGCRYGENVFAAQEALACPVIGVEEDSEGVFFAKMTAAAARNDRVTFRYMSPLTLDFADGSFDVVILEGVFAAYPRGKALAEALRVLRSGGTLAVSDSCWLADTVPAFVRGVWESQTHKIDIRDDLIRAFESAGLTDIRHEDASRSLGKFYAQFTGEVQSIVAGGFEGMKHQKALVRHYKHEIDVYIRNGGDKYMGYVLMGGKKP